MSNRPTVEYWAQQFLTAAQIDTGNGGAVGAALLRFCDELAVLVGRAGVDAMLARAVHVARQRNPEVARAAAAVSSRPQSAADLVQMVEAVSRTQVLIDLAGELLALVAGFIGDEMTRRVLMRLAGPSAGRRQSPEEVET